MFRTLALVAVGQQHHQAAQAQPLRFARGDELVDDDLGAVGEIAELGFPQDQRVGLGERIAVFEAEHRHFGERRIDDLEQCLVRRQVLQRQVFGLGLLIDQHGMTVGEGTPAAVLARQAHRRALDQQRAESQRLGKRPVDAFAAVDHLLAGVQLPGNLAVQVEVVRHVAQLAADPAQLPLVDGGIAADIFAARRLHAGPGAFQPVCLVGFVAAGRLEIFFQPLLELADDALGFPVGQDALVDQLPAVDFAHRLVARDRAVHQRLGEGRLVALVMAVAPVAEHVDHDIGLEGVAELHGDAGDMDDRFRIVAVHMEDRRLHDLGELGAVGAGAAVHRIGGEADLVVDDEMNRAAGAVAVEVGEVEGLRHHSLAGEGGVAMQQQAHHLAPGAACPGALGGALGLLGAHLAGDDRVDRLQMGRVGGERQMDRVAVEIPVRRRAEMVFDVARALDVLRVGGIALEFREDRLVGLAHHVGEHVEPAAVGHADDDFLDAELAAALDDLFERRDGRLGAVQAETLGAGIFLVEEALEDLGLDQAAENGLLAHGGEFGAVLDRLDTRLQPGFLVRILDVHEFHADRAGIGRFAAGDDLAQCRGLAEAEIVADEDAPVEVARRKAVGLVVQLRMVFALFDAERIEPREKVAAHPVAADQDERADRIPRGFANFGICRRGRGGRRSRRRAGRPNIFSGRRPVVAERPIVTGRSAVADHPGRPGRPVRPGKVGQRGLGAVVEIVEEVAPVVGDRARIGEIAFVQIDDEGRVGPGEVGGRLEFTRRLCHGSGLLAVAAAAPGPRRTPLNTNE